MSYIAKMLGQPSSYAGLSAGALAYAGTHPGTPVSYAAYVAAGVFGLLAFFIDGNRK
jgi:hypothetical protein